MSPGAPRRIHLYRPQNQLGDLLLNVPAIRAIRRRYPEAHITLIVGPQNAPAVQGQAWVDEIRVLSGRGAWAAFREALRVEPRPDLSVYFTTVSYSVTGALLSARGARERVGFDPSRYGKRDWARLTSVVPYPSGALHQSEVCLALARAGRSRRSAVSLSLRPRSRALVARPSGVAYLHPGAGKLKNRWPVERFAEVAAALAGAGSTCRCSRGRRTPGLRRRCRGAWAARCPSCAGSRSRCSPRDSRARRSTWGTTPARCISREPWDVPRWACTAGPTLANGGRSGAACAVRAEDATLESVGVESVLEAAFAMLEGADRSP